MVKCGAKNIVSGYPQKENGFDTIDDANGQKASVIDFEANAILIQIFDQLKIMNMHLSKMTDERIDIGDFSA